MRSLRFRPQARQDLLDLWLYIARSNPSAADRVFDRIESACRRLREFPDLGPARPDLGEGMRALIIDRWLAIYELSRDAVEIARVVDGSRDLTQLE